MFEAGCDIHRGAEVVERVAGSDCDARSGMKSELSLSCERNCSTVWSQAASASGEAQVMSRPVVSVINIGAAP